MARTVVHGSPSKSFFIDMLTKDIKVSDSILDLMDNSIDSALAITKLDVMRLLEGKSLGEGLQGYRITIEYDRESFRLADNCGGISIEDAENRVFLLGNPNARSAKRGLSVYGIGMKRAFFKLGNDIHLESETDREYFVLDIDVGEWRAKGDSDWDFQFTRTGDARKSVPAGTRIVVKNLDPDVSRQFQMHSFRDELEKRVASTYALFIEAGLEVKVNGRHVVSTLPELGGQRSTPARHEFLSDGVRVLVIAGVTPREDRIQRGIYVFCNGRMVLDADRTKLTGWSDLLPQWHSKYGHFVGYLYFESDDVNKLPWMTTKQGVVYESAIYQEALRELSVQAAPVLKFLTRLYPGDVPEEGLPEREALDQVKSVRITELKPQNAVFHVELPRQEPGDRTITIQFPKKAKDVDRVKKCFPKLNSAKAVGSYAFDYFVKRECPE